VDRWLDFACCCIAHFNAQTIALPDNVVEASYGRLCLAHLRHVNECEVFSGRVQDIAVDYFAKLFKQIGEFGNASRRRHIAHEHFDDRHWTVYVTPVLFFLLQVDRLTSQSS
jgi:hypothetical protein